MVPQRRGDARGIKNDLVVSPQAFEETEDPAFCVARLRRKSQDFRQGSAPVDGAEQPVLEGIDGENEIGKRVRPVDQHRNAAGR